MSFYTFIQGTSYIHKWAIGLLYNHPSVMWRNTHQTPCFHHVMYEWTVVFLKFLSREHEEISLSPSSHSLTHSSSLSLLLSSHSLSSATLDPDLIECQVTGNGGGGVLVLLFVGQWQILYLRSQVLSLPFVLWISGILGFYGKKEDKARVSIIYWTCFGA